MGVLCKKKKNEIYIFGKCVLEAVGIMFSPVITIPGFRHETKARNKNCWWLVMGKLTF